MYQPTIGFAGMSHLGINSAVATAERGFHTVCFDIDKTLIENFKKQCLPIVEPTLPELLAKHCLTKKIEFSDDAAMLGQCDVVYIASDVPTNDRGVSDLASIYALIQQVLAHLNPNALLVILCQVPPGFTRALKTELPLERVYYQVETLIFGRAIERALYPERFIIGCADPAISIDSRYSSLLAAFECPILPMRYESAELSKISINCCLVASISVANMLSEICEKIGANWAEIVPALKLDKRIGANAYLAPGLGIAGGNLERDLETILNFSEFYGTEAGIVKSWLRNSQYRKDWVLKILQSHVLLTNKNPTIAVLGLTYKENTHSTKNSPSLLLLQHLRSYNVRVYDPVVDCSIVSWAHSATSVEQALKGADVLIIMTPWPVFRTMTLEELKKTMCGRVIIDPYQLLAFLELEKEGFHYSALGVDITC